MLFLASIVPKIIKPIKINFDNDTINLIAIIFYIIVYNNFQIMSVCSVSTIQAPFPQVTIRSSIEMDILQFKKGFFFSGNKNVFFLTYIKYHFRAIKKHCA